MPVLATQRHEGLAHEGLTHRGLGVYIGAAHLASVEEEQTAIQEKTDRNWGCLVCVVEVDDLESPLPWLETAKFLLGW